MGKEQKPGWINKAVLARQQKDAEDKKASDAVALAKALEENRKQQRILEPESEANKFLEMWDKCRAPELLMDIKENLYQQCRVHSTFLFFRGGFSPIKLSREGEVFYSHYGSKGEHESLRSVLVSFSLNNSVECVDNTKFSHIASEIYYTESTGGWADDPGGERKVTVFSLKLGREGWIVSGQGNWMETNLGNQATINTPEKLGEQLDNFLAKLILNPYIEPPHHGRHAR